MRCIASVLVCSTCSSSSILKFGIRVTCCRVYFRFDFLFDLADVKTRKSAFKRGFSASVAKESKLFDLQWMRALFEAYTCAHNNVHWVAKWTRRLELVCDREREHFMNVSIISIAKSCDSNFYMALVCFVSFFLRLHNLVFQNMKFMRFCLMLRIDPFIHFTNM